MKRYLALVFCVAVMFTAVSCGRGGDKINPPVKNIDEEVLNPGESDDESQNPEELEQDDEKEDDSDSELPEGLLDMEGRSPVTGMNYSGDYKPILVMIENSPAARPQSGLADADVVYEIYTEGKITRFLAVFNDNESPEVGPVRSVRHYYLDIYREWNTLLVHYGASVFAADEYNKDSGIRRLDGMVSDKYFWRDSARKAPHNAYTSTDKCKEKVREVPREQRFLFVAYNQHEGQAYEKLSIPYANSNQVSYQYDAEQKTHLRSIGGSAHTDRITNKQITVKNIIVQYAKHTSMNTSGGHIDVQMVGSGKACFFIEGKWFEGTWKKESKSSKTRYYDADGEEVAMVTGNTWIEIVPNGFEITIE